MARKVGRKRTSTKRISEEQRAYNNYYNRLKYHYKKAGVWERQKEVWKKKNIQTLIDLMKEQNSGQAVAGMTPLSVIRQRAEYMGDIVNTQKKNNIGIKNIFKTYYELSESGEEISIMERGVDKQYKYMFDQETGKHLGLRNGRIVELNEEQVTYIDEETGELMTDYEYTVDEEAERYVEYKGKKSSDYKGNIYYD